MYKSHDKEVKIFALKIAIAVLIMFLSFIIGLFSGIIYWLITFAAGGLIVWECVSFAEKGGRKRVR